MRRDEEFYFNKIFNLFKDNFNSKVTEINTEKNDSVKLDKIQSSAFYYDNFPDEFKNYTPFINFTLETTPDQTVGMASSQILRVMVELVISDKLVAGNDGKIKYVLRYRRALREIVTDNFVSLNQPKLYEQPDLVMADYNCYSLAIGLEITITN